MVSGLICILCKDIYTPTGPLNKALLQTNESFKFQVAAMVHSGQVWRRRPAETTRRSTPSPAPRGSGSVWAQSRPQCNNIEWSKQRTMQSSVRKTLVWHWRHIRKICNRVRNIHRPYDTRTPYLSARMIELLCDADFCQRGRESPRTVLSRPHWSEIGAWEILWG